MIVDSKRSQCEYQGAQRRLPKNTQFSTYSKLMFKVTVSLPKIYPCSPGWQRNAIASLPRVGFLERPCN